MFADSQICATLKAMLEAIEVPPVPLAEIQQKTAQRVPTQRRSPVLMRALLAGAAAIALALIAFPSVSFAVIQSIEDHYAAALRALGYHEPPPVPSSFLKLIDSRRATLVSAQKLVPFTIVAPAGLPKDVISESIRTTDTGVYIRATHSWHKGPPDVTFTYRRSGGRSFTLLADAYDPKSWVPPKFLFQPKDDAPGPNVPLIKHRNFAWRNGNQMMTVAESPDLSASEIETIRAAMNGITIPLVDTRGHSPRATGKLYVLP